MRRHRMYDKHGNLIDDDVLPDGGKVVVPMRFADAWHREMHAHLTDSPAVVTDALGDSSVAALSRPGSGFVTGGTRGVEFAQRITADHMRAEALADSIRETSNAWKGSTNDREVPVKRRSDDPVADAYLDQVADLENA